MLDMKLNSTQQRIDMSIDDQSLEDLMAELEAQTAQFEDDEVKNSNEQEKTLDESKSDKSNEQAEQAEQAESDAVEISSALAELEMAMNPTKGQELDAKQAVQLDEVFNPDEESEAFKSDLEEIEALQENAKNVKAEPNNDVVIDEQASATPLETSSELEASPIDELSADLPSKEIAFEKPTSEKEKLSESEVRKNAELQYRPDLTAFQLETKVTDANLSQSMMDQSALVAYYGARFAQAEEQAARCKMKFEILEAGLFNAYRKHFAELGEKTTEKSIENAVRLDKKWAKGKKLLIEAEMYADVHRTFMTSLRDRCSMLMQYGADRREEMKGQLRTIERENYEIAERESVANRAQTLAQRALTK